jgi:hypothetical protein
MILFKKSAFLLKPTVKLVVLKTWKFIIISAMPNSRVMGSNQTLIARLSLLFAGIHLLN